MKEVKVTNSDKFALVDDEDFDFINAFSWRLDKDGYAVSGRNISGKTCIFKMHKEVWSARNGSNPEMIDHINRNKLDNTKVNLREITNQLNQLNRNGVANTSSKYKGVTYNKKRNKFRASATKEDKFYSFGYFISEDQAALAADIARSIVYPDSGNFLWLNCDEFPYLKDLKFGGFHSKTVTQLRKKGLDVSKYNL